jgi:hypothetical protein
MPFSGFVLSDGRRGGICWDEKPRCIHDHLLVPKQKEPILTEAITTCVHRPTRDSAPCGVRLYAALLSFGGSAAVRGKGERAWIIVEITPDHVERMRREPMIFLERMVILGVALPGVEIDLLGHVRLET